MIAAGRGIQALLTSSLPLYRELIEQEWLECEFESRGLLFAYRSQPRDGCLRRNRPPDDRNVRLPGATMRREPSSSQLEPALRPGLAGGWYYHDDAHLRPDKLMQAWRQSIAARAP